MFQEPPLALQNKCQQICVTLDVESVLGAGSTEVHKNYVVYDKLQAV